MKTETVSKLRAIIQDPVRYSKRLMQADLWEGQHWILRSIMQRGRTAVKACHASGKTFAAALAVLWWITRYPDGIAVTTAPTWLQVEKLLWGDIHKALAKSRIAYPTANLTELTLGEGNYALGISTNESERFQGFHGMRVLMVLDEAPGVRNPIYDAIEGIRAGGDVRVLALGNPVIASGPFHEAFTTQRESWRTKTISAFDTPNLAPLMEGCVNDAERIERLLALTEEELDTNVRPYLTTRRWVKEKWLEWGQHHNPLWDARVLGVFPAQAVDALFPLLYLEQASYRENVTVAKMLRPRIGIDVAGPGDNETVVYIMLGNNVLGPWAFNDPDPRGAVLALLRPYRPSNPLINVDAIGMGYYFAQHLQDAGFQVNFVNVSKPSTDPERFTNLRAQLHWNLRERFEEGSINGITDETTISQLAGIRYRHNGRGQVEVESKDHMAARGIKSPDRAEALMLANAAEVLVTDDVAFV